MRILLSLVAALAVACGGASGSQNGSSTAPEAGEPAPPPPDEELANEVVVNLTPYGGETYGGSTEGYDPAEDDALVGDPDDNGAVEGGVEGGVVGGVEGDVMGGVMGSGPPPPPPSKSAPQIVPQHALDALRISGDARIVPDDGTKLAIERDGKSRVVASIKMCVDTTGTVSSTDVIKSSGYPAYDARLEVGMRTWKYKPFTVNGNAVDVCTSVTFIYAQS